MKLDKLWFMAEDDGGGGGGYEPDLLSGGSEGSANDTPEGTASVVPEVKPAFDPKEFASVFAKEFVAAQPKAEPKETPLTPEQIKQQLNVWEPSDEWLAKYDNLETRKAAIAEQRDAMQKQFDTVAQLRMYKMQHDLNTRYAPMVTAYQEQQQAKQQERFEKTFPQLADPKMKAVMSAASQSILAEKLTFKDEAAMFQEVARRTEAIVKELNPNFKLSAADAASKSGRTIPTTTVGANGGGGRSGGGTPTKVRAVDLLPGPTG